MKEIIIETSARHVHVTQEVLEKLFGEGAQLEVKKMLSQPGQFAKVLEAPIAIIDKRRPEPNKAEVMNIIGEVKDRVCIVVDDMVE